MKTLTEHHALALAYFKEGFPYDDTDTVLFEVTTNGGDFEFFSWVLMDIIPIISTYLEQYDIDETDKLYVFYGDEFPHQLKKLLKQTSRPTRQALEQCAENTLNTIATEMREIRNS